MDKVTVPVDMNSEQKNILGVISTRQFIYIGGGAVLLYSYIPTVYSFLNKTLGFFLALGVCGVLALPVLVFVIMFGFIPVSKRNMNRDFYYLIRIQSKFEKGSWRKGS